MKERPILFSGAMVRAILDGRKTQTRRVIKDEWFRCLDPEDPDDMGNILAQCPYGVPGDRLWVRETWATESQGPDEYPRIIWRADMAAADYAGPADPAKWKATPPGSRSRLYTLPFEHHVARWRPSIHMPRWASRITLKVKDVRCERLQEITAADILAEGAVTRPHVIEGLSGKCPVSAFDGAVYPDLRSLWVKGWDSINAKRGFGWATNPWVWVVEFRRLESGET